jgi:glucose/arabinose dehydrogenase
VGKGAATRKSIREDHVMYKLMRAVFLFLLLPLSLLYWGCNNGGSGGNNSGPAQPGWPQISAPDVASGFSSPVHITHAGDGSGRIFVVEQAGIIRIIKNGNILPAPFLDITGRVLSTGSEQGLLSVAFPPGYSSKGYFYVNYTAIQGNGDTVVARYRISGDPNIADPNTEQILLTVDQPFANHNGGLLLFGPDGYLYIGMGDGGSGGDPLKNGQNPGTLLGKMLRIDSESNPGNAPYVIPPTNPFIQNPAFLGEIWALGLRNPWRYSFDRQKGDIYIADVGQSSWEEVDFQSASSAGGENYGWNIMEGNHCFLDPACVTTDLILPVTEYDHSSGDCSITGGMVYRGQEFPGLQGIYLYGDFCTGRIWGLRRSGSAWETSLLLDSPFLISTFGEDEAGNIYVADYSSGTIYKIVAQK